MKKLVLVCALGACDPTPVPEPPRAPVTTVAAPRPYLVWSRTDAKSPTYETVLLAADGAVLAKRRGVFVAGATLYEVKVVDERIPATGCSGGQALQDQPFAHVEVVDVATGKSVLTLAKRVPLMNHDDGIAQFEGERTVKIVGSIGTKVSLLEHELAWECSWGRELAFAHAIDLATGKTEVFGTCSPISKSTAAKTFAARGVERDLNVNEETECLGVTAELDAQHTWVAHHRLANHAAPKVGIGDQLLEVDAEEPLPPSLDEPMPEPVKAFAATRPDVRGYAQVGSDAIRALFTR